ncbi:Abi-alpha family protein [Amycolatopsis minnesotensis]|uniref:Abi-alpha family protein n=1 Tax=Amycolatopsis minnesotensis TaxID=337894 RepID=A0ABP5BEQ9_9PSEU
MSNEDRLVSPVPEPGLVQRAGKFAGWAARTGYSLSKRLPGVEAAEKGLRQVERIALGELRRRLDEVDDPYLAALSAASAISPQNEDNGKRSESVVIVPARESDPLRAAMAELLNRSLGFGKERAREYLYAIILRQLTPDEARILSALSDGSPFPVVDVFERTSLTGTGRTVLRNASTVGKAAGVSLPAETPSYVTRLVGLGLADLDEEVDSLATQYEILLTDETVRAAEDSVKRAKIVRRTVHLSHLGTQFWRACDPAAGPA